MKKFKRSFSKQVAKRQKPKIKAKDTIFNKSEMYKYKFNQNHKNAKYI